MDKKEQALNIIREAIAQFKPQFDPEAYEWCAKNTANGVVYWGSHEEVSRQFGEWLNQTNKHIKHVGEEAYSQIIDTYNKQKYGGKMRRKNMVITMQDPKTSQFVKLYTTGVDYKEGKAVYRVLGGELEAYKIAVALQEERSVPVKVKYDHANQVYLVEVYHKEAV